MQWQHGSYVVDSGGVLRLTPIEVDGRQLLSDPCAADKGIYTRYNQTETFNVRAIREATSSGSQTNFPPVFQSIRGLISQRPTTRPPEIRRLLHAPNVFGLPATSDATH